MCGSATMQVAGGSYIRNLGDVGTLVPQLTPACHTDHSGHMHWMRFMRGAIVNGSP